MTCSIYLAGPEVFLPDALTIADAKRRICERFGFEGRFPLDGFTGPPPDGALSAAIFSANIGMIAGADAVVANLTPFRGLSADAGTVFELGAAYAMGKPVFGYTNLRGTMLERAGTSSHLVPLRLAPDGQHYAADGLSVENFGLADNLMIIEALLASGTGIVEPEDTPLDPWRDLSAFEACIRIAARTLTRSSNS